MVHGSGLICLFLVSGYSENKNQQYNERRQMRPKRLMENCEPPSGRLNPCPFRPEHASLVYDVVMVIAGWITNKILCVSI